MLFRSPDRSHDMNTPNHTPRGNLTVTPSKPVSALQMVQGGYYVLAGLLVAFAIATIQGPTDYPERPTNLWPVRIVALAVAGLGAALVASSRGVVSLPSWTGLWTALTLLLLTAVGMGMGVLTQSFLIDAGFEALFFACWVVAILNRGDRRVARPAPLPSA